MRSQMPLKIVKLPKQLPKLQEVMQWHAFGIRIPACCG